MKKTVDGIKLDIDPRIFSDVAFIDGMTALMLVNNDNDDEEEQAEQSAQAMNELREVAALVFGKQLKPIQKKLREQGEGFLSYDKWIEFIVDVVNAFQQENDESNPTLSEV